MKAFAIALLAGVVFATAGASLSDSVQPLYGATESFLDLVQPADKSFLLKEFVPRLINGTLWRYIRDVDIPQKSREYAQSMLGYSILICLGLALIILVPLCGCCVCCCRCCCGKCGGKLSYMERKGAKCRRGVYGLLFLAFVTFVLFGAVLAMVSNQILRDQFSPRSGDGSGALDGVSDSAGRIADSLAALPQRGREATPRVVSDLARGLSPSLNRTLTLLQDLLLTNSDAAGALEAASGAVDKLATCQLAFANSSAGHAALQWPVVGLNQTLFEISKSYLAPGANWCPPRAAVSDCRIVNDTLQNLVSLDLLPGATVLAGLGAALTAQNATELALRLGRVRGEMNNISVAGMEIVNKYIADGLNSLNQSDVIKLWDRVDGSLRDALHELDRFRNVSQRMVFNPITRSPSSLGDVVSAFDSYRYYTYIGLGSLMLLFVALFYLGLIYGCGGGPPYEDAGCCNRGVGANFLLCGSALAFMFYALVLLFTMVLFLAGGLAHTEVCRYLRNQPGSYGYAILDDIALQAMRRGGGSGGGELIIGNVTLNVTRPVSTLLGGCPPDNSLARIVDLGLVVRGLGVPASIDEFLSNAKTQFVRRAGEFVPQGAFNVTEFDQLELQVANATKFNASGYADGVSQLLSGSFVTELQRALYNISQDTLNATEKARYGQYHSNLTLALGALNSSVADQMATVALLVNTLRALNASLSGLTGRISAVAVALRSPTLVRGAFDNATLGLPDELLSGATTGLGVLLKDVVDCSSLGRQLRQVIDVPCARILQPFNGFWAGIGICLLGLLPCLLLAIKLANLYRKEQKYLPDMDDRSPKPI